MENGNIMKTEDKKRLIILILKLTAFSSILFIIFIEIIGILMRFIFPHKQTLNIGPGIFTPILIFIYILIQVLICVIKIIKYQNDFIKKIAWIFLLVIYIMFLVYFLHFFL